MNQKGFWDSGNWFKTKLIKSAFQLLKRQSHEKVCSLQKFVVVRYTYDAEVYDNILQIRETGFTSRVPLIGNIIAFKRDV
jgi:hypothetical protein